MQQHKQHSKRVQSIIDGREGAFLKELGQVKDSVDMEMLLSSSEHYPKLTQRTAQNKRYHYDTVEKFLPQIIEKILAEELAGSASVLILKSLRNDGFPYSDEITMRSILTKEQLDSLREMALRVTAEQKFIDENGLNVEAHYVAKATGKTELPLMHYVQERRVDARSGTDFTDKVWEGYMSELDAYTTDLGKIKVYQSVIDRIKEGVKALFQGKDKEPEPQR